MSAQHRLSRLTSHPTLVALIIGGLVLAGGIALIVVLSGSDNTAQHGDRQAAARLTPTSASTSPKVIPPTSAPVKSTPPTATPVSRAKSKSTGAAQSPSKPITYVVKKGDNLTVIAKWFKQHGYSSLYERNKAVIGDDPNLIFPGQKITVSTSGMSLGG